MVIGKVLSIDELLEDGFEAVFIGSGAGLPRFMGIPGENLKGVYSANEFLTRVNLMKAYRDGQRNADSARQKGCGCRRRQRGDGRGALRKAPGRGRGLYRLPPFSETELPARAEEVEHAKEEGIVFKLLT